MITPQIREMELFVSIEDIQVPPESVKTQMKTKKPQPEPVKEISIPTKALPLQIKKQENIEPVKEVKKETVAEVKDELIKVELKSSTQPINENREPLFVPPVSSITKNSYESTQVGATSTASIVEKPSDIISHHVTESKASSPIETSFGASVAPAFLHREMPVYPMMARKLGREGRVVLKLTIDEKGNLLNVEVIERADYGFTEAAMEAVKKSTFLPAKKDGKPIASRALLPIKFQLKRN